MTEVAGFLPTDHQLTNVRHYEAGPPKDLQLVEPGETFATVKEEEWVSKKKTEVTNTKQVETRVKRQVVLEDGKVVEDSGPQVTTNTTEDTETQEHHQTELRKLGDDEKNKALEDRTDLVAVPNPAGVVREVKEKKVISREETEEVKETENVQHFGDITDEDFLAAVHSGKNDLRNVIRTKDHNNIMSTGPRLIKDTYKNCKTTDTENKREVSSLLPDGKIVTEIERTTEHEVVKDDELPEEVPDQHTYKESSQRYLKTRDQEEVDYLVDGVKIGHEMRLKTDTMEVEKRGIDQGLDEPDFDSLSAQARKRSTTINGGRQPHRYRLENGASPLDRKDAITRRPLDFDQEEETRKVETSKWLEHHFGSESRSSNNSLIDEEEHPPKTSFFNVTIKSSQPPPNPQSPSSPPPPASLFMNNNKMSYVATLNTPSPSSGLYSPSPEEPERDRNNAYFKGITEWSERRHETYNYTSQRSSSPIDRPPHHPRSPLPDYGGDMRASSKREYREPTPTPPQRKRAEHRKLEEKTTTATIQQQQQQQRYRRDEPLEEPPPDYSPPSNEKKAHQKTRFAPDPPKQTKTGNIIGQSIRKLVGKIRSASAERKAKQRAKRSPSPSYQKGHVIDNNIGVHENGGRPVQRYYLGEDPFAGSIYGRENKYDGVRPMRSRKKDEEQHRSQSTLGRFSKSTSRLLNSAETSGRSSQTLPRPLTRSHHQNHHLQQHHEPSTTRLDKSNRSNSTINVSIINNVTRPLQNEGPAKPARTYKSNLSRSKSLNVRSGESSHKMYTSNPHLNRFGDGATMGLKSPGLISSLSRSQKDLHEDTYAPHFTISRTNGFDATPDGSRRVVIKSPPVQDEWTRKYDVYEPPTRLRDTAHIAAKPQSILRRGSNSSTDFSETYHTTTRNDDPLRPSITNTIKSFSKKTIPSKDGRALETIESSETKSITKSHYQSTSPKLKFGGHSEIERKYVSTSPVIIEVRNNYRN